MANIPSQQDVELFSQSVKHACRDNRTPRTASGRELDAARPYWQHVSTVNPICILQLIVKAKGRARTKIIKELSEIP